MPIDSDLQQHTNNIYFNNALQIYMDGISSIENCLFNQTAISSDLFTKLVLKVHYCSKKYFIIIWGSNN